MNDLPMTRTGLADWFAARTTAVHRNGRFLGNAGTVVIATRHWHRKGKPKSWVGGLIRFPSIPRETLVSSNEAPWYLLVVHFKPEPETDPRYSVVPLGLAARAGHLSVLDDGRMLFTGALEYSQATPFQGGSVGDGFFTEPQPSATAKLQTLLRNE